MVTELTGNVILPDTILYGAKVTWEKGRITRILPDVCKDTQDLPYIAPGFIDIHNHGALGRDYMDDTENTLGVVAGYLASRGVTSAQCTTVSAPVAQLKDFMAAYRRYQEAPKEGCRYVGIHIEGPYISPPTL